MRVNLSKIVNLCGITIFAALLFFAPFLSVSTPDGTTQSFTFNQLMNGASPYLMAGSHVGSAAAMPAIPLLIALFLPNYAETGWTKKRLTVVSLILAITFLAASALPLVQGMSLVLHLDVTSGASYKVAGLWGSSAVTYLGLGLLFFMALSVFPKVRETAFGLQELAKAQASDK